MASSSKALLIGVAAALAATGAAAAAPKAAHKTAAAPECDRVCLDGLADRYMDAMVARAPASLPWADVVRYSENSVPMAIGDGVWATVTAHTSTPLRAADPKAGQVAWMGEIEEHGQPGFFALRLKVVGRKIAEAEAVIRRKGGPPQYGDPQAWAHDPAFAQAATGRLGRAQMVSLVDGYLDALQGKPGARPQLDPGCARVDNGVVTTSGAAAEGGVEGCSAQFAAGLFKPIARVRARLYPVVDEERGVVIAAGFLDLPARAEKPTGPKALSFATDFPYSLGFMTAFKLRNGRVWLIDGVSGAVPYLMPSPYGGGPPH